MKIIVRLNLMKTKCMLYYLKCELNKSDPKILLGDQIQQRWYGF